MKKTLLLSLLILFVSVCVIYTPTDAGTKSLNISNTTETLEIGKSLTLKVNGVKSKKIKWKSSKKSIATVSKTGVVKAKKCGKTTITGKYKGVTFKTKITVTPSDLSILIADTKLVKIHLTKISNGKTYLSVYNKTKNVISADVQYLTLNGTEYSYETGCDGNIVTIAPSGKRNIYIETPNVTEITSLDGLVGIWEGDTGYLISYIPVKKK